MAVFLSSAIGIMLTFLFEASYERIIYLLTITEPLFWAFVILVILQTELPIIGTIDHYFSKLNEKLSKYNQKRKTKQGSKNMKNVLIVLENIPEETYMEIVIENFSNEHYLTGGFLAEKNRARFVFMGEDNVPKRIRKLQKGNPAIVPSDPVKDQLDKLMQDIREGKSVNLQEIAGNPEFLMKAIQMLAQNKPAN